MLLPTPMPEKDAALKNVLSLAFVGDTVWDLLVRGRLLRTDYPAGKLHILAIREVNATAQRAALARIEPALTEREQDVVRRGCNAHAKHDAPRHQDAVSYSAATGLEALLGYLYLTGQEDRVQMLFDIACPMLYNG